MLRADYLGNHEKLFVFYICTESCRHWIWLTLIQWCPQTYMDRHPGLGGPGQWFLSVLIFLVQLKNKNTSSWISHITTALNFTICSICSKYLVSYIVTNTTCMMDLFDIPLCGKIFDTCIFFYYISWEIKRYLDRQAGLQGPDPCSCCPTFYSLAPFLLILPCVLIFTKISNLIAMRKSIYGVGDTHFVGVNALIDSLMGDKKHFWYNIGKGGTRIYWDDVVLFGWLYSLCLIPMCWYSSQ